MLLNEWILLCHLKAQQYQKKSVQVREGRLYHTTLSYQDFSKWRGWLFFFGGWGRGKASDYGVLPPLTTVLLRINLSFFEWVKDGIPKARVEKRIKVRVSLKWMSWREDGRAECEHHTILASSALKWKIVSCAVHCAKSIMWLIIWYASQLAICQYIDGALCMDVSSFGGQTK